MVFGGIDHIAYRCVLHIYIYVCVLYIYMCVCVLYIYMCVFSIYTYGVVPEQEGKACLAPAGTMCLETPYIYQEFSVRNLWGLFPRFFSHLFAYQWIK